MKQITIVTEDRTGLLADISEALAAAGVNIETLDVEGVSGSAVVRMTVDKYDDALRALAACSFQAISEDALVLQMDDVPGALAQVARRFRDANINLRSVRLIWRGSGKCWVAVAAERTEAVLALVKDLLVVQGLPSAGEDPGT
jgi:hypothetical protein